MIKRKWLFGVAALALIGIAVLARGLWTSDRAAAARAQGQGCPRGAGRGRQSGAQAGAGARSMRSAPSPPSPASPSRRASTPPSTACISRTAPTSMTGELLFTLDCRAVDAQIAQTAGQYRAATRRSLHGAELDVARYTSLVAKNATSQQTLDTATTRPTSSAPRSRPTRACWKISRSSAAIARSRRRLPAASAPPPSRSAISCARPTLRRWRPSTRWRRSMSASRFRRKSLPAIRSALDRQDRDRRGAHSRRPEARRRPGQHDREHASTPRPAWRPSAPPCRTTDERLWPGTLVTTELTLRSRRGGGGADGRRASQPDRQFRLRRRQQQRRQGPARRRPSGRSTTKPSSPPASTAARPS